MASYNKFVLLSVLDQSPIPEGFHAGDALRNTLDLARSADALGYHRYWLAEHHGARGLACSSPEVMIGQVAMATKRIKVGSGGIMLPHYSPLKVAESFSMLAALYPGRIDLGIGRAPGHHRVILAGLGRRQGRLPGPADDARVGSQRQQPAHALRVVQAGRQKQRRLPQLIQVIDWQARLG